MTDLELTALELAHIERHLMMCSTCTGITNKITAYLAQIKFKVKVIDTARCEKCGQIKGANHQCPKEKKDGREINQA